jgi:hypothetical protein
MFRTNPWFVDDAIRFLNGFLKWRDSFCAATACIPTVLEIGGGSSTLFFLGKGLSVVCIEADEQWRSRLRFSAHEMGVHVCETSSPCPHVEPNGSGVRTLHLVDASEYPAIPDWVFVPNYLLMVCDGIDRWKTFDRLMSVQQEGLLLVDNLEYASDWGRLPLSSGWPERAAGFRSHIFDKSRNWLLFEQPQGRSAHCTPDSVGIGVCPRFG